MNRTLGPYRLQAPLSRGGLGTVYSAIGPDGGQCCVKVITNLTSATQRTLERFRREAGALFSIDHPNVVRVRDFGVHAGTPYLAMDLVQGTSAEERLQQGPLPVGEAVAIARELVDACAACHAAGLLHRDLKPANVILGADSQVTLVDFGLAKFMDADMKRLTVSGAFHGTPGYMPPEQINGNHGEVSYASDVYSIGATLYALLTGEPPFVGESLLEVVIATESTPATEPSALRGAVPVWLDQVVMNCLNKDPQARPTLGELAVALALGGGSAERVAEGHRRPSPSKAWLAAGPIAAGILLVGWLAWPAPERPGDGPESPVPPAEVGPRSPEAQTWYERGLAFEEEGDLAGAMRAFSNALEASPEDPEGLFGWGRCSYAMGNHEEAIRAFSGALQATSDRELQATVQKHLGLVYTVVRDFSAAIQAFRSSLEVFPDDPGVLGNLATALSLSGSPKEALGVANRAIELEPESDPTLYVIRAQVHRNLEHVEQALSDLTSAIKLAPKDSALWARRGRYLKDLRRWEEATADLDAAVTLSPTSRNLRYDRAKLLGFVGRYAEAVADFEVLLETDPGSFRVLESLANCLTGAEDLGPAAEVCDRILEQANPRSYRAHALRGYVKHLQGDPQAALADLDRALELWSAYTFGRVYRCKVLADLGRAEEALGQIEAVLADAPDNVWGLAVHGYVLRSLGKLRLAEAEYVKALEFRPIRSTRNTIERELAACRDLLKAR